MIRPLVVVADDDPTYLAMMIDVLDDAGYEAIAANKDSCAFGLVCAHQPVLVIIELLIMAPERGLHILNQIRCNADTSAIPVIIASTSPSLLRQHTDFLHDQQCGILPKPFDLEVLFALIREHVAR